VSCRIAILGDSSSSGIGQGGCCYPARLSSLLRDIGAKITNYAVPGFTSADACRFFRTVLLKERFDCLIIYLGNNEGAASPYKGRDSRTRLRAWLPRQRKRRFQPILSPPRFRFRYDVCAPTTATTPRDFHQNLDRIVRSAIRERTRVIIVNPIANRGFPCGLGAPNASYFCYLDGLDRLGGAASNEPIDEPSEALAAGLRFFHADRWDDAAALWDRVARADDVAGFIARHNLECLQALAGDAGCEARFRALLGEYANYDAIILYNLAQLRRQGDDEEARRLLDRAYDEDTSLYRIRRQYRTAIAALAARRQVRLIDLQQLLHPSHFIDYCHPTEEGHDVIAHALSALIRLDGWPASSEAPSYRVVLPTPDYFNQPEATLVDYYCIDWPIEQRRIARLMPAARQPDSALGDCFDRRLADCLRNFFLCNQRHPIFTENINLTESWTPRSHEILSFPELFLYRILSCYSAAFERDALLDRLACASRLSRFRISAADYQRLILRKGNDPIEIVLDLRHEYYQAIVSKVRWSLLNSERIYSVLIGDRIRTVVTWYTREAFRFGTQSRFSMLYARWEIEEIVEALIVAVVIAARRENWCELPGLDRLLGLAIALIEVHERHVQLYHRTASEFSARSYRVALAEVRGSIRREIDGPADATGQEAASAPAPQAAGLLGR
jgi:lysophospholipase L1-like esterase